MMNSHLIVTPKPPVCNGEKAYAFISYSHKDSALVYEDLWRLHNSGFRFWYDDGITAGECWNKAAGEKIISDQCEVVIFFVSENSLDSDPIRREMKIAKDSNKKFFSVLLEDIDIPQAIGLLLRRKAIKMSDSALYSHFFNEDILYISRSASTYFAEISKHLITYGLSEAAVLVNAEQPTTLDDKLRSFVREDLCPESMIVPLKRALLGDRETRREVQSDLEDARPKVRRQFLACMEKLIDFPDEVVRGEAYFCLGSYSDERERINEAFFVRGLQDKSDFVKACCANVLQFYVPLDAETVDALEEIVERIHLIGLENAGKYTRKLHYYAKRTLRYNGGNRR